MFENETSALKVAVLIHLKGFRSNKTVMNSYWVFGGKKCYFYHKRHKHVKFIDSIFITWLKTKNAVKYLFVGQTKL